MGENAVRAGQYLSFKLGEGHYAIPVARVEVVLEKQPITRVPRARPWLRGVTNHRGAVIPVVDLRLRFGMGETPIVEGMSIIVLQLDFDGDAVTVGMLADGVREVIDLEKTELESAPDVGGKLDRKAIAAIGKKGDDFIVILDVDEAFASEGASFAADEGE
ncbi:MAG: chemotaxis protein CheW [Spirochaetales bacterium]|nr:chemotaxis protein CheW [Spirochaetales bacterium]